MEGEGTPEREEVQVTLEIDARGSSLLRHVRACLTALHHAQVDERHRRAEHWVKIVVAKGRPRRKRELQEHALVAVP